MPGILIKNTDGSLVHFPLDNHGGLTVIDYAHHEIHEGNSYVMSSYKDQGAGNVRDLQFVTGNKELHFSGQIYVEAETLWHFYEDVTISTYGTAFTPLNLNRNYPNKSSIRAFAIDNADLADANIDTVVTNAVTLSEGISGAGNKVTGSEQHEHEYILKPNTAYTIRLIATSAGFVTYHFTWYED